MVVFRLVFLLLLVGAGICFALFMATGQAKFKRFGVVILKWTLLAALAFFAAMTVESLLTR